MSLLHEIQNELARSDADVTAVLRKCKILAARLKSAEFARWVDQELEGYPDDQTLPDYRKISITFFGSFANVAWKLPRIAIPLSVVPKKYRDAFQFVKFKDGIAKVASFSKAGSLVMERPDLVFAVSDLCPDMECLRVWGETSATEFHQILSSVTSRILDFSLKLEQENPAAGEAPPGSEPVPKDKLAPLVHNVFFGSVGNIAQNSNNFTQNTTVGVSPEDLLRFVTEFTNHLDELALDQRQKERAKAQLAALRAESSGEPDPVIVKQAALSLRNITEGTIASLLATAVQPTVWIWIHEILKVL